MLALHVYYTAQVQQSSVQGIFEYNSILEKEWFIYSVQIPLTWTNISWKVVTRPKSHFILKPNLSVNEEVWLMLLEKVSKTLFKKKNH